MRVDLYDGLQVNKLHVYQKAGCRYMVQCMIDIHRLATNRKLYVSITVGHERGGTPAIQWQISLPSRWHDIVSRWQVLPASES